LTRRRRRSSDAGDFLSVSRRQLAALRVTPRQLAGLGVVGLIFTLSALNGVVQLGELGVRLERRVRGG
jgi:hypothetical protein